MRNFDTTTGAILSRGSPAINDIIETKGYATKGDGGGAQWKHNGVTGQTPSQSPANLADALINDASGNQWSLIKENDELPLRTVGAVADSSTDDTSAWVAALASGGVISIPSGTTVVSSTLTVKTGTVIKGLGMGRSVVKVSSSLSLTDHLFINENIPVSRARQDSDIHFKDFTIDGAGRSYISYPTSGYSDKGYLITLNGVINPSIIRLEVKNHQSLGINDLGCLNLKIRDCSFHDNGKNDDISSPVFSQAYGSTRKIINITSANPAVVTMDVAIGSLVNGNSVYIEGVDGMESIPDGDYVVGNISSNTFELTGINTSTDTGFTDNQTSFVGLAGSTTNWVPSENTVVTGCNFYDNARSGISFMPAHGGILSGNTFRNNGESTIFSERGSRITITNNNIRETTLTDIISAGIEVNQCGILNVSNNHIEDTATDGLVIQGCVSWIANNNTLKDIITDNTITYPVGPLSVSAGIDGDVIDKTRVALFSSLDDSPLANGNVNGNIITDTRINPQATKGFLLGKAGTNNIVYDLDIKGNDFASSGLATTDMIDVSAASVCVDEKINIKGNKGHASEGAVVQQATISATGLNTYDLGFVPSMVEVEAIQLNATNSRTSRTFVVRDRTNITSGTLGIGTRQSADGLESSSTTDIDAENNIITNDFYRVTNGAGTAIALAEFTSWNCDSTTIGVTMNVGTATTSVRLTLVFYP